MSRSWPTAVIIAIILLLLRAIFVFPARVGIVCGY